MLYHNLRALLLPLLDDIPNERLLSAKSTSTDIPCLGSIEQWTLRRDSVSRNAPYVNHMILCFLSISQETWLFVVKYNNS